MNNSDRTIMAILRRDVDGKAVYAAKSANYTAVLNDNNAFIRFTAAATLALDSAATLGANWHVTVIAAGGDVTIDPNGSETINGSTTLLVPSGFQLDVVCDGTAFFTENPSLKADATAVGSFIDGGLLSNNSGNPNTHVDFAAMSVRSASTFVSSASSITKRLNGTWAVGSGGGGLDTGSVAANATYYAYALRKATDGTLDVVFSTSATIAGVNTTLLTGYTVVKQIGVVLTDGSSIIRPFVMYPRDEYTWATPVKDAVSVSISTTSALLALTVPNGAKAKAKLRFEFTSSATTNAALLSDPAQGVLAAGIGGDGANFGTIQVASGFAVGCSEIWTNTNRQIRHVAGASGSLWVWTDGFYFPCGRTA
ncbi:hypothetical protein [Rhizobium lentis]|uniref:hypothetical protein n=1 Tax=Rhizobium lentis TaxID=1138194 RepID=UPI002180CE5B|nr:hypothetical protein [Rhizobium lentis]